VDGTLQIVKQLQGYEISAAAWEAEVLSRRVAHYEPEFLDELCLAGEVMWARLSPHPAFEGDEPTGLNFMRLMLARFRADHTSARIVAVFHGALRRPGVSAFTLSVPEADNRLFAPLAPYPPFSVSTSACASAESHLAPPSTAAISQPSLSMTSVTGSPSALPSLCRVSKESPLGSA